MNTSILSYYNILEDIKKYKDDIYKAGDYGVLLLKNELINWGLKVQEETC